MKCLNQLRIDAGYSIVDVCQLMNVDQDTVCRWLSGTTIPNDDECARLACLLGVDVLVLGTMGQHVEPARMARLRARVLAAGGRFT